MSASARNEIEQAAERWLARHDRGLTGGEQAEFARWVAVPEHAEAYREIAEPFAALDRIAQLRPLGGGRPDPDLLLKERGGRGSRVEGAAGVKLGRGRAVRWLAIGGMAAAAALAVAFFSLWKFAAPAPAGASGIHGAVVRHTPERLTLPDGSRVEMKRGTVLETAYSGGERRVRLRSGEAFFDVAKDAARPFVVDVDKVAVRAVGTAFIVSATTAEVEVVVTEGRVRVDDARGQTLIDGGAMPERRPAVEPVPMRGLDAGQRVVIVTTAAVPTAGPALEATPAVIERASAWRKVWLEFGEMRLAEVVQEFNRAAREHGGGELRVADEATGRVLVSGTFRADGTEAFVRVLETTFGIKASVGSDGATLLKRGE